MVQVNKEKGETTIVMDNCGVDELTGIQTAMINLMKGYRFEDHTQDCGQTMYYALALLGHTLPNYEQQKRGFTSGPDYLELPENLTPQQREKLEDALFALKTGEKVKVKKNTVLEALQSIEI